VFCCDFSVLTRAILNLEPGDKLSGQKRTRYGYKPNFVQVATYQGISNFFKEVRDKPFLVKTSGRLEIEIGRLEYQN